MAKVKVPEPSAPKKRGRPALSPEARQNQMIALAMDLVEQRLLDGTATSQETTHFLKLASDESRLKNKLLEAQAEVAMAKKHELESRERTEKLFEDAIKAFKNYSGQGDPDDY